MRWSDGCLRTVLIFLNSEGEGPLAARQRRWLLLLLLLINTFNFADRTVLSVVGQAIKSDMALSDTQLGLLQGLSFAIFYSLLGLPIASLAERVSRVKLISSAAGVWSLMATASGLIQSYLQLFCARVGVGIGEAAFQPVAASLIADHYPARKRGSAMSIVSLGGAVGPLLGAAGGGWIASHYDWRHALIFIGAPGLILALLAFSTLKEPVTNRFPFDHVPSKPGTLATTVRYMFAKRAFVYLLAGTTLASFATNSVGPFLAPYFVRRFHLDYGQAGLLFGISLSCSGFIGILAGGFGIDRLARFDARWLVWLPSLALAAAGPLFVIAFAQRELDMSVAYLCVASAALFTYYSPSMAVTQDLAHDGIRATAAFLVSVAGGLIGIGMGPVVTGMSSDRLASYLYHDEITQCLGQGSAACADALADGVQYAMSLSMLSLPIAALMFFMAGRTLREDLAVA